MCVRAVGGCVDVLDSSLLKQMKEATDRKRIVSTIVFEIHQVRQRQEWCVVPRTLHVDCACALSVLKILKTTGTNHAIVVSS